MTNAECVDGDYRGKAHSRAVFYPDTGQPPQRDYKSSPVLPIRC